MKTKQKDIKKIIEEKDRQLAEYVEHLQRLQADFENFQKRVEKERRELVDLANAKLISQILPVLDNFEKALETVEAKVEKNVKGGINMIFNDLNSTLKKEGLEAIKAKGELFDPFKHDVIDVVEGDKEDHIVDELQKGYTFKGKVLRASKVRVSKKKDVEKTSYIGGKQNE